MKILRFCIDQWLRLSAWWQRRREIYESLGERLERQRITHQREADDLRAQLAIEQKNAEFLALINAKHRAMIEAEIALHKRLEADALGKAPQK